MIVQLATVAFLSMAGLGGGGDEEGIEVPAANEIWKATLTDATLTEAELEEFSWDGYTHMQGTLGAGTIAIKFGDIASIDFEPTEKNKSIALVKLKNGTIKKIGVDGRVNLYGKTGFGNYKIQIKDVKKLVFEGGPTPRPSGTPKKTAEKTAAP